MLKRIGKILMITLLILASLIAVGGVFMRQAKFGRAPEGERLARIQRSPHYKNGSFQNLEQTPQIVEGASYVGLLKKFLFERSRRSAPSSTLPSLKRDLFALDPHEDVIVWFGHASYFMQIDGKKFLVDPVFSGSASPVSFTTKSFPGTDAYTTNDIPEIDVLLITHDHWDHLDYETLLPLKPKIKRIVTGLGVGSHLESWGFDPAIINEMDWNESVDLQDGFELNATTARHFSGRSYIRNNTLWVSFVLSTPTKKIFLSGDGGYGAHFKDIGNRFGPFDLAVLECGQYNENWKYIHMNPEETVKAAVDLRAMTFLPVHWSKFVLALHDWDDPIRRVTAESRRLSVPVLHPMIGEVVMVSDSVYTDNWWEAVH
jgi:L-ascorbate metabolism protein UlaG (beta-lactamase superfamily)